jgi:predicted enzyme related to lactoylglutathione lyase
VSRARSRDGATSFGALGCGGRNDHVCGETLTYVDEERRGISKAKMLDTTCMGSLLREIVIDCADPGAVCAFWSDVLGWEVQSEGEWYWMAPPGADQTKDLAMVFLPVREAKTVKNRVHIDVSPTGCDQANELVRLLALGAVRVNVGQGEQPWVVMADPEGNEFCLLHNQVG